jgi:hypothetical protein
MSEAELHILRSRLRGGILSKARRGELQTPLPVGLIYDPAGRVVLDPDTAVQGALRHLFDSFARTDSARAVVKQFADQGLSFPQRIRSGERQGELHWAPLEHYRVLQVLHNPRYAGAFCYGRRQQQRSAGKLTRVRVAQKEWIALIKDAHPGYITYAQFEQNQSTLADNCQAHGTDRKAGPPREGPALLQGLVICGRCGARMTVRYHHRRGHAHPTYSCERRSTQTATTPICQNIPGTGVDHAVGELLLQTLTPLALEVALAVAAELEQRASEADQLRAKHVERARHEAELARRRYLAVDPENRLVADTLEADWNEKLRQLSDAQDDYDRAHANGNGHLSEDQRAKVIALATDFPKLWNDPATPQRERKRMIRLLLDDVTLIRDQQITAHVRLKGGQTHTLTLPRPRPATELRCTATELIEKIDRLLNDHTEGEIARILNQQGDRSFEGKPFTATSVQRLRASRRLVSRRERLRKRGLLTPTEIAQQLNVHTDTIKKWHAAGLLTADNINDKHDRLYHPPTAGDPRLVKHAGWRLKHRQSNPSTPGGAV